MFSIELKWKEFKIHLPAFDNKIRSMCPSYVGNTASEKLILYFNSKPNKLEMDRIEEYWDSLTEEKECNLISQYEKEQMAIQKAISAIPYSDLFSLIPAEKKILMGQPLNEIDKEALVQKYIKE